MAVPQLLVGSPEAACHTQGTGWERTHGTLAGSGWSREAWQGQVCEDKGAMRAGHRLAVHPWWTAAWWWWTAKRRQLGGRVAVLPRPLTRKAGLLLPSPGRLGLHCLK